MRRIIAAAVALAALALAGCTAGSDPNTIDGQPYPTRAQSVCKQYEAQPLMSVRGAHGITPTHSVRVDVFRCDEASRTWVEVFNNSAHVEITATSDAIASGTVKAGANYPWPYQNLAARTPFEFPLYIAPGLSAVIVARASTVLDKGWAIACWIVTRDGRDLPGSRWLTVSPARGAEVETDCSGTIEG